MTKPKDVYGTPWGEILTASDTDMLRVADKPTIDLKDTEPCQKCNGRGKIRINETQTGFDLALCECKKP